MSIKYYCDNKKCGKQLTIGEAQDPIVYYCKIMTTGIDTEGLQIKLSIRNNRENFTNNLHDKDGYERHLCADCTKIALNSISIDIDKRIEKYEEALKFYAEGKHFHSTQPPEPIELICTEYGEIARAALEENK